MDEHECCYQLWDPRLWNHLQCTRKGTVEVNKKWYCWEHDPARVTKQCKDRQEKIDRKYQGSLNEGYRRLAEQDVCQGVSTEELEKLGTDGLLYLMDISLRYRNIVNNSKGG